MAQIDNCVEGIMGSISMGNYGNLTPSNITFDDLKEAFLTKEWNLFHIAVKKLNYLLLKDFLKCECEFYLKQPLTPSRSKIIGDYCTSNRRFVIEIRWWSTIPISRENKLCHFCSYNIVESEAHFVLECPLYDSIRGKFQSLFDNVVLGSLKPFFQLDHQVDISLSRRLLFFATLAGLTPS